MSAADWGIPSVSQGQPIAPIGALFGAQAEALATALDLIKSQTVAAVGSASERNKLFPTPKQGNRVFRTDTGQEETYLAAYDGSTNQGGAYAAGWYATGGNLGYAENYDGTTSTIGTTGWTTATAWGNASFYSGARQLVLVTVSATFGIGNVGTPAASGAASFMASGATTYDATSYGDSLRGASPGVTDAGSFARYIMVNAGVTQFRGYMTKNQGDSISVRGKRIMVKGMGGATPVTIP